MKTLTRYIMITNVQIATLVLCVLFAILMFFNLVANIGGNSLNDALMLMLFSLPGDASQLIPTGSLIGALLALGTLANHSELVAMRAGGFSLLSICKGVTAAASVFMLLLFLNNAFLAPWANRQSDLIDQGLHKNHKNQPLATNVWLRANNSLINVGNVWADGRLLKVSRYQFNDTGLTTINYANLVRYQNNQWQAHQVDTTTILSPQHIQYRHDSEDTWDNLLSPTMLAVITTPADNLDFFGLIANIKYRYHNGLSTQRYAFHLWQNITIPLSVLIMMLLAVPFVFGPLRSVSLGLRMLVGIVVGFSFFVFNEFFSSMSTLIHFSPLLAAATPSILFLLLFFMGTRKIR